MPKVNFVQKIHNSTKRDCLGRMVDEKVKCMKIARKFSKIFLMEDEDMDMGDINICLDIYLYWQKKSLNIIN